MRRPVRSRRAPARPRASRAASKARASQRSVNASRTRASTATVNSPPGPARLMVATPPPKPAGRRAGAAGPGAECGCSALGVPGAATAVPGRSGKPLARSPGRLGSRRPRQAAGTVRRFGALRHLEQETVGLRVTDGRRHRAGRAGSRASSPIFPLRAEVGAPPPRSTNPSSRQTARASGASASRSRRSRVARARDTRERTVPTGQPVKPAASS